MRANALAEQLKNKNYNKFWNNVKKHNNSRSTKYACSVGGCTGDDAIAEMWKCHFQNLYNSIPVDQTKDSVLLELNALNRDKEHVMEVDDINQACKSAKLGKAIGADGIAMESIVYGGLRLRVHMSLMFNMFLCNSFLPKAFMHSVIVPLVKCKNGDLSDVNNYRAICISTAMSKILEYAISDAVQATDKCDAYQFGFKAGHSTELCTNVLQESCAIAKMTARCALYK